MKINPYLNFDGKAEEAFHFYQSVFGGELTLMRMSDAPESEKFTEEERNLVLHVSLPIADGQHLMASDCIKSFGQNLTMGNNNYISVAPDSRDETTRLYKELSAGGTIEMPLDDMFWGDYFASFKDKYGVCWMLNFSSKN